MQHLVRHQKYRARLNTIGVMADNMKVWPFWTPSWIAQNAQGWPRFTLQILAMDTLNHATKSEKKKKLNTTFAACTKPSWSFAIRCSRNSPPHAIFMGRCFWCDENRRCLYLKVVEWSSVALVDQVSRRRCYQTRIRLSCPIPRHTNVPITNLSHNYLNCIPKYSPLYIFFH